MERYNFLPTLSWANWNHLQEYMWSMKCSNVVFAYAFWLLKEISVGIIKVRNFSQQFYIYASIKQFTFSRNTFFFLLLMLYSCDSRAQGQLNCLQCKIQKWYVISTNPAQSSSRISYVLCLSPMTTYELLYCWAIRIMKYEITVYLRLYF